ncbi:MAG: PEGA domain-containing protein [bacterium]|nr:PEGA domain-containing protein [bacterium]
MSKKIFFWFLVALFFTTAPLVIFYSIGYRFNPQRGIFVYTGSLSIKSNPQNVEVYIDGKIENKTINRINNSYHLGGIKPGEHLIEVNAPGFNSWNKKIAVNSGTSTEFWNVVLTRSDYARKSYPTTGIEKFFFDPGKRMIAYTQNIGQGFSVNILDISANKSETVFTSSEYSFIDDEKENMEWAPKIQSVIIPAIKNNEKTYFIVDIGREKIENIKDLTGADKIEKVRWDKNNKNFIFYLLEGDLHYMDTQNPSENKIIAKGVSSYDISSGYVYFFRLSNGIIYRANPEGNEDSQQITTSAPDNMNDPNYKITVYDQDRIALLNKSGELYIYNNGGRNNYFQRLASGISETQFSNDGKKMIYWNDREVSVYFTRDWEVQPWRSENEQKEIIRFSEKINNVQWSKDYEHVIFSVRNKIKTAEIDNRGQNNIQDILSLDSDKTRIVSDFSNNQLYFINQINNQNNLYSVTFPETIGILGFGGN